MGTPFMGELRAVSFNFAPKGWAQCNGQFLPINQNQALFSLLGTMYGGNGQTTFALPDLRGAVPVHIGDWATNYGQAGGQAFHTLTQSEMPAHNHFLNASLGQPDADPNGNIATGRFFCSSPPLVYSDKNTNLTTFAPAQISNVGGSQPHENRHPYLVLMFCIALQGVFPSHN
jgi:microcystin-dependent protein